MMSEIDKIPEKFPMIHDDSRKIHEYLALFEENEAFHKYVERLKRPGKGYENRETIGILREKIVQNVGDYYKKAANDKSSTVFPVFTKDICDCEDKSC